MLSSAWASWIYFESEVEVEAAKGVPYRWPLLRADQLWYEVYSSCEKKDYNVMYSIDGVH